MDRFMRVKKVQEKKKKKKKKKKGVQVGEPACA